MCDLSPDDEEVSLVIEAACPDGGHAGNDNHVADAPDEDTLSVGPDMPDLPLDAPPDPETSLTPTSTAEAPTAEEVQPVEKEEAEATPEVEQEPVEEEITVREDPPPTELTVDQEDGASAEQPEENSGAGGEQEEREVGEEEEQRAESAVQAQEGAEEKEDGGETQSKSDSDNPVAVTTTDEATTVEAPTQGNIASQEAPVEPVEGNPQGVTEGGESSCVPCTCQSLFSNYNSQAPLRRKNRPCSLPVSELETVIASACGEPETPRSHYIRIHHLLHSLPSAQHRTPSQEEEENGQGENTSITQDTTSTSPSLKTSKEEGQDDEEEDDTTQSPSQVQTLMNCTEG